MKNKLLFTALFTALVTLSGCANEPQPDTKTAMQKKYTSAADCTKDFPTAGDCVRVTGNTGSPGAVQQAGGGGGFFFMSPFFYPWGGVMHNNGTTSYNQRVPTSGYFAAPPSSRLATASKAVNFSRVPASYSTRAGSSTRGGFGGSARGSYSSGG